MHLSGINDRCMGLLRQRVTTAHIRSLLLVEMIARSARDSLHKKLREVVRKVLFQF